METLQISKANALTAYDQANDKGKKLLANLFGAKTFIKDIKERIKTFQDALDYTGETLEQFNERTKYDSPDEIGYKKCKVICLALNEGEVQDYKNPSAVKYYPWFNAVGSGAGFSYGVYGFVSADSSVGARLLLKSKELAIYAGKQFTKEYNEFING